jgi:uncharacterized protein YdeI (YjbR/CyaY-like superfamily)
MASKSCEYPIKSFVSSKEWKSWLEKNHAGASGIWLRFYKKNSGVRSVNYAEALDEALCFGWIDSQIKKYDKKSYIQRFTPRRAKSILSKRNIESVKRLKEAGRMNPSGVKEAESAHNDGRWKNAYNSPISMKMPQDFIDKVSKNEKCHA